ncbi:hypothetical protein AAVH_14434 [Aphelenchoides avenae]|nr:hypothetical protein AAVH_14434 [Aphelenchus avenae]
MGLVVSCLRSIASPQWHARITGKKENRIKLVLVSCFRIRPKLVSNYGFSKTQKEIETTYTNEEIWREYYGNATGIGSRMRKALQALFRLLKQMPWRFPPRSELRVLAELYSEDHYPECMNSTVVCMKIVESVRGPMSTIQTTPVEILLDVFRANDPADMDALQLTFRRFLTTIRQNEDTLPTRLLYDLVYGHESVWLYRSPANGGSGRDVDGYQKREPIASGEQTPDGIQQMYQMFGRKIAVRELDVWTGDAPPDAALTLLLEHFPSVKAAVRLDVHIFRAAPLPTDAVLERFTRLETIWLGTSVDRDRKNSSFWSDLFATKAFRRVPNFLGVNHSDSFHDDRAPYPHADVGELFDFITDFSLMPPDKPRVVSFEMFSGCGPLHNALEQRFSEDSASIGGQVCAQVSGYVFYEIPGDVYDEYEWRYLTNMASGSQKETFALELFRKITYYRE